jgi:transcriptional regulator with XRE-family HTH domain
MLLYQALSVCQHIFLSLTKLFSEFGNFVLPFRKLCGTIFLQKEVGMMEKYERIESVSQRLRKAMDISKKTQADLVRETEISKGTLSRYLSGKFEPKQIAINKLAIALNVSEMWLWGCDVPMDRPAETKKEQPTEYDGLSEKKKALMQFAMSVPEDKAEMILQVMKTILKND